MCFNFESFLLNLVLLCGIIAFVRLLLPALLAQIGVAGGLIAAAINIIIWMIVAWLVIRMFFAVAACFGGFSLLH